jgi:NAD(P)-dependent dehydrogenase (short-subunit alcohol dehydrogenase family)
MASMSLEGRTCLVTGATSGIGLAVACALASRGARVIGVGRDALRSEKARAEVARAAAGGPVPEWEITDLGLMREVEGLAARILAREGSLDVLVNCAGVFTARRRLSPEGLETQFAVNHLAPFLLTTSLLPLLEAAPEARVITVSSASHFYGRIHWRDPSLSAFYLGLWAYEQSKLANVLFSYELVRRLGPGTKVRVAVADPGLANTAMGKKQGLSPSSLFWSLRRRAGSPPSVPAEAIAFLAEAPRNLVGTGLYWKGKAAMASSRLSYREADAARLWAMSEAMVEAALGRLPKKPPS